MIGKLDIIRDSENCVDAFGDTHNVAGHKVINKINELVDAVNELQNRIDPPSVYQVMKDKDAIIGKHIGEKQRLQDELEHTRKALGDTIKLAEEMLKDIDDEGLCSWQYKERLNKITAEQKE